MNYNWELINAFPKSIWARCCDTGDKTIDSFHRVQCADGASVTLTALNSDNQILVFQFTPKLCDLCIASFPQLSVQCLASDIHCLGDISATLTVGGAQWCEYGGSLILLLNKMRNDLRNCKQRRQLAALSWLLRQAGVFEHVTKSIVAFYQLQNTQWAPYVWMHKMTHEMQEIESIYKPRYLIPLCLPLGKRFCAPCFQIVRISVRDLPEVMLNPRPQLVVAKTRNENEETHANGVESDRLIGLFEKVGDSQSVHGDAAAIVLNENQFSINLFTSSGVVCCFLIHINGTTNANHIELHFNNNIAVSGPLKQFAPGGWFSIVSDPNYDTASIINIQSIDNVKLFDMVNVDSAKLVFSNGCKDAPVQVPKQIKVYAQYVNVARDADGCAGLVFT